jgi:hypothetical protein
MLDDMVLAPNFGGSQGMSGNRTAIGWQSLLEGRPALGGAACNCYYEWLGGRRSGVGCALIPKYGTSRGTCGITEIECYTSRAFGCTRPTDPADYSEFNMGLPVSPQLQLYFRVGSRLSITTGLSNGMAHSNTSGTGTCQTAIMDHDKRNNEIPSTRNARNCRWLVQ